MNGLSRVSQFVCISKRNNPYKTKKTQNEGKYLAKGPREEGILSNYISILNSVSQQSFSSP